MIDTTDESCMSCLDCKNCYRLEKLDYSHGGCKHTDMEGFICMVFADEGVANWMVGLDEEKGHCEMYEKNA